MTKLPIGHVTMIPYDFSYVLWRHIFLLRIHKPKFALLGVALCLQLLPFSCCL